MNSKTEGAVGRQLHAGEDWRHDGSGDRRLLVTVGFQPKTGVALGVIFFPRHRFASPFSSPPADGILESLGCQNRISLARDSPVRLDKLMPVKATGKTAKPAPPSAQPVARTPKGIAGVVIGVFLIVAGGILAVFPTPGIVFLYISLESSRYMVRGLSQEACRIYGLLALTFGIGLVWLARWPGWGARRRAIEDYVWNLSQELSRHFGSRKYYGVDEVSRVAAESGCQKAYMAYAHAMFCSRSGFDDYYGPLHVACTYDGLRAVISRRYFAGALGFDAATIVRLATPPRAEEYGSI